MFSYRPQPRIKPFLTTVQRIAFIVAVKRINLSVERELTVLNAVGDTPDHRPHVFDGLLIAVDLIEAQHRVKLCVLDPQ